jgi:hypothetical protein
MNAIEEIIDQGVGNGVGQSVGRDVAQTADQVAEEVLDLIDQVLAPDSPEELAKYDAESIQLINARAAHVGQLESEWEGLHASASAKKKQFELAQDELRSLIRERADQRGKPLQKDLFSEVGSGIGNAVLNDDELWQQYPISFERWKQFGLTESDCEKFNTGETKSHGVIPINTMGDMSRYTTPNPNNPGFVRHLKDIKGIGEAAEERWFDASIKFWGWWGSGGREEYAKEIGYVDPKVNDETSTGPDAKNRSDGDIGQEGEPAEPKPTKKARKKKQVS